MEHKAYEAVKAQHERIIAINGDGAMPRDYGQNFNAIAQLLADYEALYTENEKLKRTHSRLRTSLDAVIGHATEARNELGEPEPLKLGKSAALNTQPAPAPAAEWTPRDKQDVRVIDKAHPMSNRIGTVVDFNGAKAWVDFAYWVDSPVDGTHVYQLEVSQIAPAD